MDIRAETAADVAAVRAVNAACFPTLAEADLVDHLRGDGDAVYSLVAALAGGIAGHAMLSRMRSPARALGLGPVAVLEAFRERGVAAALIREGLDQARADGWGAVFVLGDPDYYRRFGFDPALAEGFFSPHAGPHLMGMALSADGLPVRNGPLAYAAAFDLLD
jgi:putative acetyltransferase